MDKVPRDAFRNLRSLIDRAIEDNEQLAMAYKNLHQGNREETLERFLRARDNHVAKAYKMLLDCLHWRMNNDIDNVLSKLIEPKDTYDAIRDSQLIGMTGFCKQGRPVFAIGVGLSGYDKAPIDKYVQSHIQINEYRDKVLLAESSKKMGRYIGSCLKILDMTHLKLSALNRIKILTIISTVDDLNYPEKTDVYYIVNAPYIFSACWKVVKPLLQERTRRKVQVLQGCGREQLLEVMDYDVLPSFCRTEPKHGGGSGSSNGGSRGGGSSNGGSRNGDSSLDCYSSSHAFHVELWNYIKQHSYMSSKCMGPISQKSFHVEVPEPDDEVQTFETALESALVKLADENSPEALNGLLNMKPGGS